MRVFDSAAMRLGAALLAAKAHRSEPMSQGTAKLSRLLAVWLGVTAIMLALSPINMAVADTTLDTIVVNPPPRLERSGYATTGGSLQ